MSLLDHIIEEHKHALNAKGYDAVSLGSSNRPGKFIDDLRANLIKAIADMPIDTAPTEFSLLTDAFPGGFRDPVHIEFYYRFDANEANLHLYQLIVKDHRRELSIELTKDELPHAREAHGALMKLKSIRTQQVNRPVIKMRRF